MIVLQGNAGRPLCGIICAKSPFAQSLLSVAVMFALALLCFTIRYDTNDDAVANLLVAGRMVVQAPSEFILYSHIGIGLLLKALYTHFPAIPWYAACLLLSLFSALVAIGFAVLRLKVHPYVWCVWLAVFALIAVVRLQFTIVALFASVAALSLLASAILTAPAGRVRFLYYTVILLFLTLSAAIRPEVVGLTIAFAAVIYTLLLCLTGGCRRTLLLCAGFMLVAVTVSYVLKYSNAAYYQQAAGWENFYAYNTARANLMDRSSVPYNAETQPVFTKIGWSENDYSMLMRWFYIDKERYALETLERLYDEARLTLAGRATNAPHHPRFWQELMSLYSLLFLLFMVFIVWPPKNRLAWMALMASGGIALAVYYGIATTNRPPPFRVWLPVLALISIIAAVLCARNDTKRYYIPREKIPNKTVFGSMLVILVLAHVISISEISQKMRMTLNQNIEAFGPNPDELYVIWSDALPLQLIIDPLRAQPRLKNFAALQLGVGQHEPTVQKQLAHFGIRDLYTALFNRGDIYLIAYSHDLPLLEAYIKEHYNLGIEYEVHYKSEYFEIYRVMQEGGGEP